MTFSISLKFSKNSPFHTIQIAAEGNICTKCAYAIISYKNLRDTVQKKIRKPTLVAPSEILSPAGGVSDKTADLHQPLNKKKKLDEYVVNEKILYYDSEVGKMMEGTVLKLATPTACMIVNDAGKIFHVNKRYMDKMA